MIGRGTTLIKTDSETSGWVDWRPISSATSDAGSGPGGKTAVPEPSSRGKARCSLMAMRGRARDRASRLVP